MSKDTKELEIELSWLYFEEKISKSQYDEQIKHIRESVCINNKEKEEK